MGASFWNVAQSLWELEETQQVQSDGLQPTRSSVGWLWDELKPLQTLSFDDKTEHWLDSCQGSGGWGSHFGNRVEHSVNGMKYRWFSVWTLNTDETDLFWSLEKVNQQRQQASTRLFFYFGVSERRRQTTEENTRESRERLGGDQHKQCVQPTSTLLFLQDGTKCFQM